MYPTRSIETGKVSVPYTTKAKASLAADVVPTVDALGGAASSSFYLLFSCLSRTFLPSTRPTYTLIRYKQSFFAKDDQCTTVVDISSYQGHLKKKNLTSPRVRLQTRRRAHVTTCPRAHVVHLSTRAHDVHVHTYRSRKCQSIHSGTENKRQARDVGNVCVSLFR